MLNVHLLAVGEKMPGWVAAGFQEYQKRIRGRFKLHLVEVSAIRRGKHADTERIALEEEKKIMGSIPKGAYVIALDRKGNHLSTLQLSSKMESWLELGRSVVVVIGGPEGLTERFLHKADETWSLSEMTFAHPVVRVMLAEQLYRGYSILEGLPYHR